MNNLLNYESQELLLIELKIRIKKTDLMSYNSSFLTPSTLFDNCTHSWDTEKITSCILYQIQMGDLIPTFNEKSFNKLIDKLQDALYDRIDLFYIEIESASDPKLH